jgi:hypothetical protein
MNLMTLLINNSDEKQFAARGDNRAYCALMGSD